MKTKTIGYLSLISCIVSTILMTFFEITSSYFPTRLNQKSFNASMNDQSVQTLFDNLVDDQSDIVLNNYSTIYFSHLNDNFPINSHGTCSYVGISMLLSFFDSYWDDEFIDESFEQTAFFQSTITTTQNLDIPAFNTESPGIVSEDWDDVEDLTLSQYQSFILINQNKYLQSHLIKLGHDMFGEYHFDDSNNPYGLTQYDQTQLTTYYLMYERSLYNSRSFVTSIDNYDQDSLEEYIVSRLLDGIPVMINALTNVGNHSMIAYDYDSYSGTIYVHTGWKDTNGKALSHVALDQLGVTLTSIDSAVSIDPTSIEHGYDSSNYVSSSNSSYCSCQMVYPRNIQMISGNYVDINPSFKWDSLYEEKWFREYNPYIEFSILNHNQTVIFTKNIYSGNEYTLPMDKWFEINSINSNSNYYVKLVLRSNSFINNYCIKSFNKPSQYLDAKVILSSPEYYTGYGNYYEDSNEIKETFTTHNVNDNFCFKTRRFRAGYINNECIVLSPKRLGYKEAFIEYQFVRAVDRIDIELSYWGAVTTEGLTSSTDKAVIETYTYGDYDVRNPILDLLSSTTNLPEGRNNKRTYKLLFDTPVLRIRIYAQSNSGNANNDDRGRICIGKMALYESPIYGTQYDLPTNGSELEYDQLDWNGTKYTHLNCYNYCLNYCGEKHMQPGQYASERNIGNYSDYLSDSGGFVPEYYTKEVLEEMVYWDSQCVEYQNLDKQTITGFSFGEIGEFDVCPIGTYKVALVIDKSSSKDFHWYRQNKDGTWSHKPGMGIVENWDYNGNPIYNPKYCDRRGFGYNYLDFAGFYYVSSCNFD